VGKLEFHNEVSLEEPVFVQRIVLDVS
jgi:hypothetical protein